MNSGAIDKISQVRAMSLLLIMGVMWGLQFSMLKLATQSGHSDIAILLLSLLMLSAIFWAILVKRNERFVLTRTRITFLVITSFLGYVAPLAATLKAAPHISAGVLTLVVSFTSVVAITIAVIFRTEAVSISRMVAVVLGLIAVVFVLWPEMERPAYGDTKWLLIAAIVPLCYGIESIYVSRWWPDGMTPLQVVTGEAIVAALMILPFYFVYAEPFTLSWSLGELGILLFVFAGAIEVLLYFYLIQQTGGVFVSFGTFVSLFAGIGWGMIIFSETHDQHVWMGVLFLIFALIVAGKSGQNKTIKE